MTTETKFKANMNTAVKVKFKESIFEEDFPEPGMIAWLTSIAKTTEGCYKLTFNFSEFEERNDKYLTEVYYETRHTDNSKELYTAKEAGYYNNRYTVYYGCTETLTEEENMLLLEKHLEWIEEDNQ